MKILLLNIIILFTDLVEASANIKYNYGTCSHDIRKVHTISGAVVTATTAQTHTLPVNCTTIFRSDAADDVFLVQITHADIRRVMGTCVDSLTVIEFDRSNTHRYMLLNQFCGTEDDLPIKKKFYTRGRVLKITWHQAATNQSSGLNPGSGFSLTLSSISKPPVACETETHLRCINDDCISVKLLCDGVSHCTQGEDEFSCPQNQGFTSDDSIATNGSHGYTILSAISMVANFTLVTSTTTETTTTATIKTSSYTPIATTSTVMIGWDVGSPDLISVAIVGSVFAVVLVVCIILGCREKKDQDPEGGRSTSQMNSNLGYSDSNGPPTPPPTYSYIERQTSYVSDISQRSSQISVPPDYDEALDMPDSPSGRRRSRRSRSRLSRSSTGGSSRRNRPRFPFFRSFSAQESIARYRARNSTPVEMVAGPRPSQIGSETDTLPSVREQEHDGNTSPSDDNVFESPPSTLETRVQVEVGGADTARPDFQTVPSAPADLNVISRDSSPENQRLLSDGSQQQSDAALVSERTSQDGNGEEGESHVNVTFY